MSIAKLGGLGELAARARTRYLPIPRTQRADLPCRVMQALMEDDVSTTEGPAADAWLGPAADTITDDQLESLDTASRAIEQRWPDRDLADLRERALTAAAQVILGEDTLEAVAHAWRAARAAERRCQAALTGALIAYHTGARTGLGSESDLVTRSGATRPTVRKALGK